MDIDLIDLTHYLPLFVEGLRETQDPCRFIADKALDDIFERCPHKIRPIVPQLIIPMKLALSTKIAEVIVVTLKKLQKLVQCGDGIGEALVPYYRQILPVLNIFKSKRVSLGDQMEYGQYKASNISDTIQQTLEMLETHGGEDAYINIKYMIPTYESCMY